MLKTVAYSEEHYVVEGWLNDEAADGADAEVEFAVDVAGTVESVVVHVHEML